jgi:large subunit ribosomal protein L4
MNISVPILDKNMIKVSDYVLNLSEHNIDQRIISEVIRWQLANRRANTQQIKNRSMISGAHRKIRAQKESGKARQGDGKACHFRGGGACFKIVERNHAFKLNKKFKKKALRMKTLDCASNIFIANELPDIKKTKSCANFLQKILGLADNVSKVVFVKDDMQYKASLYEFLGTKGLHYANVKPVSGLNVLSMMNTALVFDTLSMRKFEERLA